MNVMEMRLADIVPYAKNAKKHDEKQIKNVAESIRQYGFVQPIVVDADGVIVIGHCRALAAKKLGMDTVPCVCVDDLTPEQVKALRLVDNKTNESDWDMGLLQGELADLDLSDFDLEWNVQDELRDGVVEDNYDCPAPDEPKAKRGDLYKLGKHRLMCGDATSADDVQALAGGGQIDLFLTDPPYNVDYSGKTKDQLKIKNDKQKDEDFRKFLATAFANAATVLKPAGAFYIWHANTEGYNFFGACRDAKLKVRQCLVWVKNSIVIGRQDFQWKHEGCLYGEVEQEEETETCLYGWTEGKKHYFFKNRRQSTVIEIPKPTKSKEHPTMKPVRLFDYQMQCSSKVGESVLDLFAGSGTTIIAAEQNGRVAYCMELDPRYVDVIIDRWQKFTGEKAVLISENK